MRSLPVFFTSGVALVGFLLFSTDSLSTEHKTYSGAIGSYAKYVTIPGAKAVGPEQCVACHKEITNNFRHAYHSQAGVDCEECHGNGSLHVDGGGDISKIVSYTRRSAREANGACLSCHGQDEKIRNSIASKHSTNGVRCMDCHQIHGKTSGPQTTARSFDTASVGLVKATGDLVPESRVFLEPRWKSSDACIKCHESLRGEMSLPYHHPLREGKIACVDCHDPHGGPGGNNLRMANINQLCLSCHAQYRGPFAYQHPPVTENCMTCHLPHGSPNTNLLTLSMPALCLQCHAGHHNGAPLPLADRCSNCHNSVHGSDVPSATGGSVFTDKGPFGVPKTPPQPVSPTNATSSRTRGIVTARPAMAAVPSSAALLGTSSAASTAGTIGGLLAWMSENAANAAAEAPETSFTYTDYSFTPGYRFINTSGFAGRVGEYDSLQQSLGGDVGTDWVSVPHGLTVLARGNVITGDDYRIASQIGYRDIFHLSFDMRSFVQQQDNYPFYGTIISSDIVPSDSIPPGSVFGIKQRMDNVSARVKVPKLPVHLFVKGNWQARVGESQMAYFDMGGDAQCSYCHYSSQFQSVNYTTRGIGGGAEVKIGKILATYEHDYSSFNDRLQFPVGVYGATLMSEEPIPGLVPPISDTLPGNYYLNLPSPNQSSTDSVRLSWPVLSDLVFMGDVSYSRLNNNFTNFPQNSLNANATLTWNPLERLRVTADYHQQNVINNFTPYYDLYGNMSYHHHSAGVRGEYDLTHHLDVESRYEYGATSRSNSSLWPQAYSPGNTDVLYVVPSSYSNTLGLALRFHGDQHWSARLGYDWTGTHDPGYLTVPGSNNRIFTNVVLTPVSWLSFSNDANFIIQNAFPVIQRSNRFYTETAAVSLHPRPLWDLEFGYSYQQDNLATYMALMNDSEAGYTLDAPLVPYKQVSQTYWVQWGSRWFQQKLGFNARYTYNSARSGMQPDLNAAHYPAMDDPVLFQQALDVFGLASTQISQVIVPQNIGQAKIYYLFPRKFNAGLLFYYGSYRDVWNPNLNGVLRTYSFYVGRNW